MTDNKKTSLCRTISILAFLLIMIISLVGVFTTRVYAQEGNVPSISVENKTIYRGQTFEINVDLQANSGLISLVLDIEYNQIAMSLVDVKRGDALDSHTFTTTNVETDKGYLVMPFRLLWDGRAPDTSTGNLVTLTFESNIEAETGDYPINITYDPSNTNSEYETPVAVDISGGTVTLIKGEYTVNYLNYDDSLLYEKDYTGDQTPTYSGQTPTRPADDCYSYEFIGWKGVVSSVQSVICYKAQYKNIPKTYQVFFYVDGEYYNAFMCDYDSVVDLTNVPSLENHTFSGWYLDEEYTEKTNYIKMPSNDLRLYGKMVFNVRENPVPTIELSLDRIEDEYAFVAVDVTENPSLSGLILTLDYDKTALTFEGFEQGEAFRELRFDYTNTDNGYNVDPFKFFWESATNTEEVGRILTLKFKVNSDLDSGLYSVSMTYDPLSDATYVNDDGTVWYTKLNIVGASISVGKIYTWNERPSEDVSIVVYCEQGMPSDTTLVVQLITANANIADEIIKTTFGEDMSITSVYSIVLMRDGQPVQPNGSITIKIKLTDAEMACSKLNVANLAEDNTTITKYASNVQEGVMILETDHLSKWMIVGNVVRASSVKAPTNTTTIILAMSLLAIASMAFSLIIVAKLKKKGKSCESESSKGE